MTTIGIDQSFTCTAMYVVDGECNPIITIPSDKADDIFTRARHIADNVVQFANEYKPEEIRIEGLAYGSTGSATRDLAGLQMLIICELRKAGFTPTIIPPNTLKKFATTKGNASKVEMHDALPQPIKDRIAGYKKTKGLYDVVDAYWLAHYHV